MTVTKLPLSAAPSMCRHIAVGSTAAPGTPVHVGVAGTTSYDETWLYCVNNYGSNISLSVWWAGTTASDVTVTVVPNGAGRILVIDGALINNNGTIGVSCPANGTNGLVIDGFVNRIS